MDGIFDFVSLILYILCIDVTLANRGHSADRKIRQD